MAELADAIDLGSIPKGWGFKSLYPHQRKAQPFYFNHLQEQKLLSQVIFVLGLPFGHFIGILKYGRD